MKGTTARRTVATVAAFASAALIMSGCAAGTPEASAPPALELSKDPVTINITWWGSDSRAELTNQAIAAFEAKYPNITVEGEYKDFATYWDGLATATAAGDAPDVIQMDELYLSSYGQRGALLDLGTAANLLPTTNFSPDALATGQIEGVQYAIPAGVTAYAMIANKDIFDKYGVDLPDDTTWTWDDLADIANEISEKSGGAVFGAANIGGFDAGIVKYWARSEGGNVFDADGNVTLDPQALVDMWNFNMDLQKSGGEAPASTLVEQFAGGINASGVATNTAALQTNYNTQITGLQTASGQNLVLLQLPKTGSSKPDSLKPSMYWSVASTSEHPAEAAAFVDFMVNTVDAAKIIKTDRGITANTEVRDGIASILTPLDKAAISYQDSLTVGPAPVVTPNGASSFEAILQRYTQAVYFGEQTPEDAADALIAELQGEIDAAK